MDNNVQQFLDSIQELKAKKFKAYQASTKKEVDCSPLTFKQQKDIIATVADGTVGVLKFQKILNDILIENTESDTLKVEDKLPLILKIRGESLGYDLKLDGEVGSIESNIQSTRKIKSPKEKTISGAVDVVLATPTLKDENKVINYAIEILKKDGDKDAGKNIGNIYTFEIVKFIKSVKFGENEIVFGDTPVKDRVKIVENLPLSLNKEIIKYIEAFKEDEQSHLKVTINGEEKAFDIDVSFFDN